MPKSCSFEFDTCTCYRCTENRIKAERQARTEREMDVELDARAELIARQAQLRLPMLGLAHCADQPAHFGAPPPLQLEILS